MSEELEATDLAIAITKQKIAEKKCARLEAENTELKADKKRQAENLEGELERESARISDLTEENVHLLAENKRLKRGLTKAARWFDACYADDDLNIKSDIQDALAGRDDYEARKEKQIEIDSGG